MTEARPKKGFLDMNRYQWTVLFAAWLGWGFDVFDGLLFTYVAPNCVPTLLGLKIGSLEARDATLFWTGLLTFLLLVGWGVGGILFGHISDRIGRTKTLMLTMLLYSVGTALCALAPNIWALALFRFIASLGIGGEWAAGASMVAEVVPNHRRVEAGALLYTSAPLGLFLAGIVTFQVQRVHLADNPEYAWRIVFLFGLVPAAVAFLVRMFVKEPERWQATKDLAPAKFKDLFTHKHIRATASGLAMAVTALIMWWSCNGFMSVIATGLAQSHAAGLGLDKLATTQLSEDWKALASNSFNLGGLIGTLLTVPFAKYVGRKKMYLTYFLACAASILVTFGLPMEPEMRLRMYFFVGLTVFGVFGSFTYYLPELFPTRLRSTGSGFCYNTGRFIAAFGPFLVGTIASRGKDSVSLAMSLLFYVGFIPLLALFVMPWVIETRGRELED
ncbi:MAG: MFS transporter [Fimbriimonadales bacterium]